MEHSANEYSPASPENKDGDPDSAGLADDPFADVAFRTSDVSPLAVQPVGGDVTPQHAPADGGATPDAVPGSPSFALHGTDVAVRLAASFGDVGDHMDVDDDHRIGMARSLGDHELEVPALEGALQPAGDNDDEPEPSADEGGEEMPPALAEDIAAIPPPVLFGDDEKFVQTDEEADATLVPVREPRGEQPSWLVGIPSNTSFKGGGKLEDAFRGLTPVQIAMRLKYGQDHIRSTVTAESYLSLRRRGAEHLPRPLEGTLAPKVVMS